MKNLLAILIIILSFSSLKAQIDLSTNLYDIRKKGVSLFVESGITKRATIEFGLVARPVSNNKVRYVNNGFDFSFMKGSGVITRIDYKLYFTKSKFNLEGWYFSLINRCIVVYRWNERQRQDYLRRFGDNPHFDHPFQSLEFGFGLGYKKVFFNKFIFLSSVGMTFELLEQMGFTSDPVNGLGAPIVGKIGIGYRFYREKRG